MSRVPSIAAKKCFAPRSGRRLKVSLILLALFFPCFQSPLCEAQVDDGFDFLKAITIDGGYNLGDEARGVSVDSSGNIFLAGYITVPGQGRDIFLARYNEDLVEQDSVTVNGPAFGDDEGYVMAFDGAGYLYLVGYMTEADEGHNA